MTTEHLMFFKLGDGRIRQSRWRVSCHVKCQHGRWPNNMRFKFKFCAHYRKFPSSNSTLLSKPYIIYKLMYTPTYEIIPVNVSNSDAINIATYYKRKHRHLGWHGGARAA